MENPFCSRHYTSSICKNGLYAMADEIFEYALNRMLLLICLSQKVDVRV